MKNQKLNQSVWSPGFSTVETDTPDVMQDEQVRKSNDQDVLVLEKTQIKQPEVLIDGYRLMTSHSYDIGGGQRRYDGIWRPGNDGRPIVWGWALEHLQQKNTELFNQGFRMIHQHSYDIGGGQRRYDAIWAPESDVRPIVWGWTLEHLQWKNNELYKQGYRMIHQHSYDIGGGQWRYDAIWKPGSDSRPIVWGWTLDDIQYKVSELYNKRIGIGNQCLSLPKLVNNIANALNNHCVGYGFVVSYNGNTEFRVDNGLSRTAVDAPQQDFSIYRRTNLASVSKPITTVGVIQLLTTRGLSIDAPIAAWLPADWHRGPNVNTITFKQLLTHTSGIRDQKVGVDYDSLKKMIASGVSTDKSFQYQNQNFALFRIIIPYLNGFNDQGISDKATALGQAYLAYMNSRVFNPIGIQTVGANADPVNPTLFYPFPHHNMHGFNFGDSPLTCASSGLHLSMNEVSLFLNKLRFSNLLLSDQQRKLMDDHQLGWFRSSVTNGTVQSHGGYLYGPTTNGNAELQAGVYDFSIGVQVALMVNSHIEPVPTSDIVISAYNAAWEPR